MKAAATVGAAAPHFESRGGQASEPERTVPRGLQLRSGLSRFQVIEAPIHDRNEM